MLLIIFGKNTPSDYIYEHICISNGHFIISQICISQIFVAETKILEQNNLRKERFIFACCFRSLSPSWQEGHDV
jgi:hypothetical protein